MADAPSLNPDPALLPPDEIRDTFLEVLAGEGEDDGRRLADRARLAFDARPPASDALGFALALIDWAAHEVLPVVDATAIDLPRLHAWEEIDRLSGPLATRTAELDDAWATAYRAAHRHGDAAEEEYATYQAFNLVAEALAQLRRIPKYRRTDPSWKAKYPRPTPMSLCAQAAGNVASAFDYARRVGDDVEWALDRLGLGAADADAAERAVRARRALAAAGLAAPGARLVSFAEVLAGIVAVSPGGDARVLATRAIDACPDSAARIVAEEPALAALPVGEPVESVAQAARAVLVDVGARLVEHLTASLPARDVAPPVRGESTPIDPPATRPSPDDLAARLVKSLERERRTPEAAAAELRKLGDGVSDETRDAVIAAIAGATLNDPNPYAAALDAARLRLGAVDGALLVPLRLRRDKIHLWLSEPEIGPDEDDRYGRTLCGRSVADTAAEVLRIRPRHSERGRNILETYLSSDTEQVCPRCEQVAERRGMLPEASEAVPPADPPAALVDALREAVLAPPADDEERSWSLWWRVREAIERAAAEQAIADAARLGEICAQRILGPARYRRERTAFVDGCITRFVDLDGWRLVAAAAERSLPRTLLDQARQRQRAEGFAGRASRVAGERPTARSRSVAGDAPALASKCPTMDVCRSPTTRG